MAEAGRWQYLRKTGWLEVYRSERAFEAMKPRARIGGARSAVARSRSTRKARSALEPSLNAGVPACAVSGRRRRASAIR